MRAARRRSNDSEMGKAGEPNKLKLVQKEGYSAALIAQYEAFTNNVVWAPVLIVLICIGEGHGS